MKYFLFAVLLSCFASVAQADLASQIQEQTNQEFIKMDKNKDNNISKQEYIDALKSEKIDKDIMDKSMAAFNNIDINGNGKISIEEYNNFMNFAIQTIKNAISIQQQQQQK